MLLIVLVLLLVLVLGCFPIVPHYTNCGLRVTRSREILGILDHFRHFKFLLRYKDETVYIFNPKDPG